MKTISHSDKLSARERSIKGRRQRKATNKERELDQALEAVRAEVLRAIHQHAAMSTPHHGYAVIQEEVDELWDEVKADEGRSLRARAEAVQIAAMGVRYLIDITPIFSKP